MAKKQTFNDKLSKESKKKNTIKLIRSYVTDSGSIKFIEDFLQVPDGKTPENHIKEFIQTK